MTKSESREVTKVLSWVKLDINYVDIAAASISSLIRATKTTKNRNELITAAAVVPAILHSSNWII
jgi:hypothetical protein